jgi:lipoprotein-anchoring transpeptidase ErfK/SrfK
MNGSSEAVLAVAPPTVVEVARPRRRWWIWLFSSVVAALLVAVAVLGYVTSHGGWYETEAWADTQPLAVPSSPQLAEKINKRIDALEPTGIYVVIDTYGNRLRVYDGGKMLREAVCSTGSGTILKDPEKGREWTFDTPRGERRVQRKVKHPVWTKPDWAFIEDGYQPPSKTSRDRYDDFSLGDYALYIGSDGYLIHGTVFQTLLGRRVTHGCIRLGDGDLEYVYNTVPLGARVYLY